MNIIITKDYHELSRKAAAFFLNQLALKADSVFGLATGSTPLGMYQEIIKNTQGYSYSFNRVTAFNLDEYCGLNAKDPQSYHFYMWHSFFQHLDINKKNIFIPDGTAKNTKQHCAWYEKQLQKKPIDMQILGIGENGHIGFNEPGSSINSTTRLVNLSSETIKANTRFFKTEQAVPKQAITMGIKSILRAKKILLLASGSKKARAIQKMLESKISADCPASFLRTHPDVTLIIDMAAANFLKKGDYHRNGWGDVRLLNKNVVPKNKKILVVSPHPDDSAVSCAATIKALAEKNLVFTLVMTNGWRGVIGKESQAAKILKRAHEATLEAQVLGSTPIFADFKLYEQGKKFWSEDLSKLKNIWQKIKPDIVLMPHTHDEHPTHILSSQLILDFLTRYKIKNLHIWYYEGLWSQHILDQINTVFSFNKDLLMVKNKAIKSHQSQVSRLPMIEASFGLAQFRAKTIPEQLFVGYGGLSPNLGDYVEAYYEKKIN